MADDGRKLRIGVLGCGPIAQAAHFDACIRAHNAELYAICDVAEDLLARMQAVHQPHVAYNDYAAMLADPDVDAVIVAIADQFHVPMALKALQAGKHVLVEKPMGVTVEECDELRSTAAASGLTVQVGNMKRFDPGIAFARQFIREEIGELMALKAWYCDSTYRYTTVPNLQPVFETSKAIRRPGGDPKAIKTRYNLLGHGSHLVDTARYLGGEIERVRATLVQKFGAFCWFVEAGFANGAVGHLDLTIAVRMDWHEGFEIYGEFGSVVAKTPNPWFRQTSQVECFSSKDSQYHRPIGADGHSYKLQVEGFADVILNGVPQNGADVDDGTAAIRALVAIARSVEWRRPVALAEVTGDV